MQKTKRGLAVMEGAKTTDTVGCYRGLGELKSLFQPAVASRGGCWWLLEALALLAGGLHWTTTRESEWGLET